MIFKQSWKGAAVVNDVYGEAFAVTVPGNIQKDYAEANGWGDLNYMDNCEKYLDIEDWFWSYKTDIVVDKKDGERVFFVTHGIEYEYDVILNGKVLCHHEGMYTKVELDITDELANGNQLEILIYPHPKLPGASGRSQAAQCCKPADEYGWDWHPRVLVSGLWEETYIETRTSSYINDVEVLYELSEDLTSADVTVTVDCDAQTTVELYDMDGHCVYAGEEKTFRLDNVSLWWCNGQGTPYLYTWKVKSADCEKTGRVGFRRVKLVMNDNAWRYPIKMPKERSAAPITIELNGRRIFAKGSNWVNPEVFTGTISKELYDTQVDYAYEAHMNLLRCWGGAVIDKDAFFDRCDERGIMVWQEFPLACNNYVATPAYRKILTQEATAIIKRLRSRTCHVLWCGGNELFNSWSGMTEQSHALRLLDKLCYELDYSKPFIMTAPITGMAHGHYEFYDEWTDRTVFEIYRNNHKTAYSEFGCPSIAEMDQLKKIFTDEVIHQPSMDGPWKLHHGTMAWRPDSWLSLDVVKKIFGTVTTMEDSIEKTQVTQCEGYRCIFEEARRQKGECSMALNWCYNEPWITAAGNSLIGYPLKRKPAYYAVQSALRPILPSARFEHFIYHPGDQLTGELWMLNDAMETFSDTVTVYVTIDGEKKKLMTWETGTVEANKNVRGNTFYLQIPNTATQLMTVTLESAHGTNEYRLLLRNDPPAPRVPNALNF